MSLTTIHKAHQRTAGASTTSPIAAFLTEREGYVDLVFASTIRSQELIAANDPRFIGVFDCTCQPRALRKILTAALRGRTLN